MREMTFGARGKSRSDSARSAREVSVLAVQWLGASEDSRVQCRASQGECIT